MFFEATDCVDAEIHGGGRGEKVEFLADHGRAVISLRKRGADVRHSAAFNTSEQHLEKQDTYVAPGELIFQENMVNMTESVFIFKRLQ